MTAIEKSNKVISVFRLAMINIIAIDSLRNLPTNAANGYTIPLYYLIACVLFLIPCALVTAEMATHRPKTGGAYVWVREAFGPRIGLLTIWLQWVYNVFWYPTILAFIAANIAFLIDPALANSKPFMLTIIISLFLLATIVNSFGMKTSSLTSTVSAIIGTLVPMVLIIFLAGFWVLSHKPLAIKPVAENFLPNLKGLDNIAFLIVVFFSLFGLEMSAVHAESVKNPKKDYPKALLISSIIIVITLTLASLAIAMVVPAKSLDIVSGLDQAFKIFLVAFHAGWVFPLAVIAIIVGAFGSIAAWVIGPTKGLVVAAEDGFAPKIFSYRNKRGAPIAILILQAILVVVICCLFLFIKSFNTSYWILSDLTAQLALMFYILLFAAAIKLRSKTPKQDDAFTVPGKRIGIWIVGGIGLLTCIGAFFIGFIPPDKIKILSKSMYEMILILGLLFFTLPAFILYQRKKS